MYPIFDTFGLDGPVICAVARGHGYARRAPLAARGHAEGGEMKTEQRLKVLEVQNKALRRALKAAEAEVRELDCPAEMLETGRTQLRCLPSI